MVARSSSMVVYPPPPGVRLPFAFKDATAVGRALLRRVGLDPDAIPSDDTLDGTLDLPQLVMLRFVQRLAATAGPDFVSIPEDLVWVGEEHLASVFEALRALTTSPAHVRRWLKRQALWLAVTRGEPRDVVLVAALLSLPGVR